MIDTRRFGRLVVDGAPSAFAPMAFFHAFMVYGVSTEMHTMRSIPLALKAAAFFANDGTCACSQTPVNAPGTTNSATCPPPLVIWAHNLASHPAEIPPGVLEEGAGEFLPGFWGRTLPLKTSESGVALKPSVAAASHVRALCSPISMGTYDPGMRSYLEMRP